MLTLTTMRHNRQTIVNTTGGASLSANLYLKRAYAHAIY
jgi:hypothetical protein